MTGKKLLEAMNHIDEAYVEEYQGMTGKVVSVLRGFRRYRRILAASIALVILLTCAGVILQPGHTGDAAVLVSSDDSAANGMVITENSISPYNYGKYMQWYNPKEMGLRVYTFKGFGEMHRFSLHNNGNTNEVHTISYTMLDENEEYIKIYIERTDKEEKYEYIPLQSLPEGMRSMRSLMHKYTKADSYEIDGIRYLYQAGRLYGLRWEQDGLRYTVTGDLYNYPQDGVENLLIEQLLSGSMKTVKKAVAQLNADIFWGGVRTKLEMWWYDILPGFAVVLGLLLTAAPVSINGLLCLRYRKNHGKSRKPSKKRFAAVFLLTVLGVLLALLLFDQCVLFERYIVHPFINKPVRLFPPGLFQLLQTKDNMTRLEAAELLGVPQSSNHYDLWFGGKLTLEEGSWKYTAFATVSGWCVPAVVLLLCLLAFFFYRSLFYPGKRNQLFCKLWMTGILALVFVGMGLTNTYVLSQRSYEPWSRVTIEQVLRAYKETSVQNIGDILGYPTGGWDGDGIHIREWEMPFGSKFWYKNEAVEQSNGETKWVITQKGIIPFGSEFGFALQGTILLTVLTELGIYGYLFYQEQMVVYLQAFRRKTREKAIKEEA